MGMGRSDDLTLHRNHWNENFANAHIIPKPLMDEFKIALRAMTVRWPRPLPYQVVDELSIEENRQLIKEFSESLRVRRIPSTTRRQPETAFSLLPDMAVSQLLAGAAWNRFAASNGIGSLPG